MPTSGVSKYKQQTPRPQTLNLPKHIKPKAIEQDRIRAGYFLSFTPQKRHLR
ncbi:hypothetical protein C4K37_4651 [Pseudomonas chlororaphis subsp. piscium]|uniref:Uncharacterized protein n=1 Tax=Pseudomonas chlororaphis TaxID=587753 RepID=A0AAX3FS06_9PSED|nr:hypothetical protein C4K37_4651 [Pseudomonas chlororaphis subsp. piscium]AZC45574.1 hypothetical protein C4K36_4663 [Pseudomonas chlororaphis subsp. piscium]VEF73494.1 Uncharacterised protein [Pseudomonas chlororaphis]